MRHVLPPLAALLVGFAPAPLPRPSSGPTTVTLPSGLKYTDLKLGAGGAAGKGDTLRVHYTGWLAGNRRVIDSTAGRGPFTFKLGAGQVIKGWDEGLVGVKPGGKRKLMIPAELAYGAGGAPPGIPPNADLIFEVEVVQQ